LDKEFKSWFPQWNEDQFKSLDDFIKKIKVELAPKVLQKFLVRLGLNEGQTKRIL